MHITPKPHECEFPGQDDDEVVQRVIYKHLFSVLPVILVSVLVFFVGLFIFYLSAAGIPILLPFTLKSIGDSAQLRVELMPIGLGMIALSFLMGIAAVYVWRQNRMIVTDENVVDMDQRGVFRKVIATLRLSRVQDVSVDVKGPMQTIFGYGTISIQTAGEKELFVFDYVPNPYEVKSFVQNIFEQFVEHKPTESDGMHHVHRDGTSVNDDE